MASGIWLGAQPCAACASPVAPSVAPRFSRMELYTSPTFALTHSSRRSRASVSSPGWRRGRLFGYQSIRRGLEFRLGVGQLAVERRQPPILFGGSRLDTPEGVEFSA